MTDAEFDQVLLKSLKSLFFSRPDELKGICNNVMVLIDQEISNGNLPHDWTLKVLAHQRIKSIVKDLNYENVDFPVAHPTMSNREAYYIAAGHWDLDTEYGRNRFKLLNELFEYLRNSGKGKA